MTTRTRRTPRKSKQEPVKLNMDGLDEIVSNLVERIWHRSAQRRRPRMTVGSIRRATERNDNDNPDPPDAPPSANSNVVLIANPIGGDSHV